MLFRTWTREKCVEWVTHLEEQITLGVTQISNPDTGTTSYSHFQAMQVLKALYARIEELDGKRRRGGWGVYVPRIHRDR